jgi:hypothetical protein
MPLLHGGPPTVTLIPLDARLAVEKRDHQMCVMCGHKGADWHHRRTRSVVDDHQHCACNGILLCRRDHQWAHSHPESARAIGVVVSRYTVEPFTVPVLSYDGWWRHACDGTGWFVPEDRVSVIEGAPYVDEG